MSDLKKILKNQSNVTFVNIMNQHFPKKQLVFIFGFLAVALAVPLQAMADPSVHEGISCEKCHVTSVTVR